MKKQLGKIGKKSRQKKLLKQHKMTSSTLICLSSAVKNNKPLTTVYRSQI
ncbi:hypothetical protein [Candidatus Stoquefichus massiliensis]|nr:hypothetical protein [Candidatus Stoquefichus massiliensis]